MKRLILILCLVVLASFVIHAQKYTHKVEGEIAALTPSQRVDEYVNEQAFHKYDVLDEQSRLIEKYVRLDGVKAFPRITEITDEYDPTRPSGKNGRKGERFDGAWMLLSDLDNFVVRARSSDAGKHAIDSLERAIGRMRAAGYGQPEQDGWEKSGRIGVAESCLKDLKGIGSTDEIIKQTFRLEYKIVLTDVELLALSNFLAANHPEYPGWSKLIHFSDFTRFNYVGSPAGGGSTLREAKRYYEAYLEFKKINN